jgi:hypothetical protein
MSKPVLGRAGKGERVGRAKEQSYKSYRSYRSRRPAPGALESLGPRYVHPVSPLTQTASAPAPR